MLTETAIVCHAHNLRSGSDHSPDMLSKHKRHYALGMDALVSECSRNMNVIMVGHGCPGERMPWKHERYYALDMDALVSGCSRNTNVIMVWTWMLW